MERRFKVTVNGREYDVTVEDLSTTASHLLPEPGDMKVPEPPPAPPAPSPPTAGHEVDPAALPSPLAGIVVEIGASAGEEVASGQVVAAIEAMKMKTAVAAHRAGRVVAIHVKTGDAVDAGQPLMSIE